MDTTYHAIFIEGRLEGYIVFGKDNWNNKKIKYQTAHHVLLNREN